MDDVNISSKITDVLISGCVGRGAVILTLVIGTMGCNAGSMKDLVWFRASVIDGDAGKFPACFVKSVERNEHVVMHERRDSPTFASFFVDMVGSVRLEGQVVVLDPTHLKLIIIGPQDLQGDPEQQAQHVLSAMTEAVARSCQ